MSAFRMCSSVFVFPSFLHSKSAIQLAKIYANILVRMIFIAAYVGGRLVRLFVFSLRSITLKSFYTQ